MRHVTYRSAAGLTAPLAARIACRFLAALVPFAFVLALVLAFVPAAVGLAHGYVDLLLDHVRDHDSALFHLLLGDTDRVFALAGLFDLFIGAALHGLGALFRLTDGDAVFVFLIHVRRLAADDLDFLFDGFRAPDALGLAAIAASAAISLAASPTPFGAADLFVMSFIDANLAFLFGLNHLADLARSFALFGVRHEDRVLALLFLDDRLAFVVLDLLDARLGFPDAHFTLANLFLVFADHDLALFDDRFVLARLAARVATILFEQSGIGGRGANRQPNRNCQPASETFEHGFSSLLLDSRLETPKLGTTSVSDSTPSIDTTKAWAS